MSTQLIIREILDFYQSRSVGRNSEWFQSYSQNRADLFAHQLKNLLPLIPDGASVLDIGAAPFVVCEALSRKGCDVTAVDLAPERFDNLNCLTTKILKGDGEDPSSLQLEHPFDVIILSHVIEHFRRDLVGSLCGLRDLMHPDSIIIIETPNLLSLRGWISLFRRGVAYSCAGSLYHEWSKLSRLGHMGHVREYTSAELTDLLNGCGFDVKSLNYDGLVSSKNTFKRAALSACYEIFPSLRKNLLITAGI